jgi:hypothetical protein
MDRSSVERILGGMKGTLLSRFPESLQEEALEKYVQQALPTGSQAEREEFKRYWREQIWRKGEKLRFETERKERPIRIGTERPKHSSAPARPLFGEGLAEAVQLPVKGKTPNAWLTECKVFAKTRSHERQAELMGIERSVYYELKAGRRVGDATYIKAAQYITARYAPCTAADLKPPTD